MKRAIMTVAFVLAAAAAQAQGITGQNYRQYVAGATQPIVGPILLAQSAVACNTVPPSPQPLHTIVWSDPVNAGKACVYTDPGSGPLLSTAKSYGNMEGTLTNLAGGIESPESARAPFPVAPPAPTAVTVAR